MPPPPVAPEPVTGVAPEAPPVDLGEILNRIAAEGDEASLMAQLVDGADVSREPTENRPRSRARPTRWSRRGIPVWRSRRTRSPAGAPSSARWPSRTSATELRMASASAPRGDEIERAAGEPTQTDDGSPIYELGDGPTSTTLEVRYDASGRAERLVWRPYVD